jgi:ABC-type uncharacterized transport system auxiliary subunit
MTSKRPTFAFFALTALILTGCAGKVRYPDYYMLAFAPSNDPAVSDSQKLPAIAVQRFETPGYLRQGRIVYRESPEHIGFYDYHRWASDPWQTVTAAMIDSLRASGIFTVVQPYDGQEHAPFLLRGRLERLDEVDYKDGVQVEVRLSAELLNTKTGTAVWAGNATKTASVDQRQMSSVVRAMGQVTQDGIEDLVQEMKQQLFSARLAAATAVRPPAEGKVN